VHQHYHHGLVIVSLLVAVLASYTALNLASRISLAQGAAARAWLAGGGFAMGTGIWAMHFVGMLALAVPLPIIYDLPVTLLSLVIAIAVSTFALHIAARGHVTPSRLSNAGIAMGIGICSMHYVGMAAIEITPPIRYDPLWVGLSLAIAIAASVAAMWVAFTERGDTRLWRHRRALGALGMGLAITGMHYAGMVAARFPADATSTGVAVVGRGWLAGAVTVITLFVLFGTLLLLLIDAQAAARAARMQASLDRAAESSRAKDEFLAMLGHELRNPLAAIAAAVHLLEKSQPATPEFGFARRVIARQSQHLNAMVADLLDVGRAISGKMSLDLQPLGLDQAVHGALRTLTAAGKTEGRSVRCEGAPVWVNGDRTRVEQVVTNLVTNAVNHTAPGGSIEIRVRRENGDALVEVEDDGVGLDAETAPHVFELFFQGRQEISRSRGGLGVGLTLVQRIVEAHGGGVGVESEGPGKGALFSVRLPAIEAPAVRAGRAPVARVTAPRSIVLVEDADDARATLQRVLEHAGHRVVTARDGIEGLDKIIGTHPDVALVDIGLPGIDGYELARRLRSAGSRAYLVALTGYGLAVDRERARKAGFDIHVAKPAAMASLLALIDEVPAAVAKMRSQ
jgi:NO-binding membrane sensor protein with MHYT domain/ActR/RegA family two-component response regulator/two-component sensor histidine kinase